jgi:hypothetical protein
MATAKNQRKEINEAVVKEEKYKTCRYLSCLSQMLKAMRI